MSAKLMNMEENNNDNDLEQNEAERAALLQEEQRRSQQEALAKNEEETKAKISSEAENKFSNTRRTTDKLLQEAWKNVFITWTFSMFYVYVHAFLNLVFPKHFCSLGHEWSPTAIKKSSPQRAEKAGRRISLIEKAGCFSCCLFHLTLIILIIAVIYFIFNFWDVLLEAVLSWANKVLDIE